MTVARRGALEFTATGTSFRFTSAASSASLCIAVTAIGVLALRIVYTMGPVVFFASALWLIWSYPLTPARHTRMRARFRRIQARKQRLAADSGAVT